MSEKQKDMAWHAFQKLRELPDTKNIEMFVSLSGIVRIQDMANRQTEKHTRMFCILDSDNQEEIDNKVMEAFFSIREEAR